MADATKILGQSAPVAGTLTTVYTVPGATNTVISSVVFCNQNSFSVKFRLSVGVDGAADAQSQYLYYDQVIPANDTFVATIGITVDATDVVRALVSNSGVSVTIMGVEVT